MIEGFNSEESFLAFIRDAIKEDGGSFAFSRCEVKPDGDLRVSTSSHNLTPSRALMMASSFLIHVQPLSDRCDCERCQEAVKALTAACAIVLEAMKDDRIVN